MTRDVTVLGIESSCDDSAAAVVRAQIGDAVIAPGQILSSIVFGQSDMHAPFGGVVPEIAARAHAERLDHCVEQALGEAGLSLAHMDAVAVTSGPGLIGGVLSGVMMARGIAAGARLPLIGINHLEGHALTPRLTDGAAWPYLLLLISGGHCQLLIVEALGRYRRLGGSIDDAPGEAFDKIARLLGLGYPGGPEVESEAGAGDPARVTLPRPLLDRPGLDMSFSGLKTATRRARDRASERRGGLTRADRADICAAFQLAVAEVLEEKTRRAIGAYMKLAPSRPLLAVAGGVAANGLIRTRLQASAFEAGLAFLAPPLALCTDNAAMIAWAGIERLALGAIDPADLVPRPRWPLDPAAAPLIGGGRKGAKA